MNQTDWDECFLLHQRTYGETSLIVDLFSKMNGKISLIARGAKKPKSKFFGYLVPSLRFLIEGYTFFGIIINIHIFIKKFSIFLGSHKIY